MKNLEAFAIYQIFEESILGINEVQVCIKPTDLEATTWISQRLSVPCYKQDKYIVRPVTIINGTTQH